MRRATAVILGTFAGTALLVGAKYGTAATVGAGELRALDSGDPGVAGNADGSRDVALGAHRSAGLEERSAGPSPSPTGAGPAGGTGAPATPTPGGSPATGGADRTTRPQPVPTTQAPQSPAPSPTGQPVTCTNHSGAAADIELPGIGAVTVTIRVCGGTVSSASGSISQSNWSRNNQALPALNTLAVEYHKTDISRVHYSGATLTADAYRTSLTSALRKAGI